MTLAQEIFSEPPKTKAVKDALSLVEALVEADFIDEDKQKEILEHEDLVPFFTRASKKSSGEKKPRGKKKTTDPSERDGQVDEHKCMARIWAGKGKVSEYDNVQCSAKMVEGLGCFCKQHYAKDLACKKVDGLNGWFLGLVTEDKPEKILQPTKWNAKDQEYTGEISEDLRWSDSVEEKPKKKKKAKKTEEEEKPKKKKKTKKEEEKPKKEEPESEEEGELESDEEEPKKEEPKKKAKKAKKEEPKKEAKKEEPESDEEEPESDEEEEEKPKKKALSAGAKEFKMEKEDEELEAETLELPSEDEDSEEEDEYHEHEGVNYMLVDCELVDVKSGKVIGKIEGGEVTVTKHGSKIHKKNVKALGE